jgi:Protein of unknown function (DUF2730)
VTPANTNVADIVLWVVALSTLFSFGSLIWTIFSGPSRKNGNRIEAIETRLTNLETSHQRLRDRVDGLPNSDMMHRLELSLARMEGHIDKLDERLKPVAAISERMQELLMEQARK